MSADRKLWGEAQFGPASCVIGTGGSAVARSGQTITQADRLEACRAFGQERASRHFGLLIESEARSVNLVVFEFVGYGLIFVGHPPQAHLQGRVGAVASEPAAFVRLFSEKALIHHRLPL